MSISDVIIGNRTWHIEQGHVIDVLKRIPDKSIQTVVTSPPYFNLRSYGTEPQIWGGDKNCEHKWVFYTKSSNTWGIPNKNVPGLIHKNVETNTSFVPEQEQAFCSKCGAWYGELGNEPLHDCAGWATGNRCGQCFICHLTEVFMEIWRILRDDGTLWVNIGDSYAQSGGSGSGEYQKRHKQFGKVIKPGTIQQPRTAPPGLKPKDLCGIPWRLALSLQAEGWYLRSDIIWHKNAMPESVKDRVSLVHEYIFMLTKSERYYFDQESIREPYNPVSIERKRYPTPKLGGEPGQPKVKGGKGSLGGGVTTLLKDNLSGANKKSVWRITNEPTNWDYCSTCRTIFIKADRNRIKRYKETDENGNEKTIRECPVCGDKNGWVGHYASFSTELPETCIKAGASIRACEICGSPWQRIVEPSTEYAKYLGRGFHDHSHDKTQGRRQTKKKLKLTADYCTVGWKPTCKCDNKGLISSIVLDPFSGSGRSGLAALRLGMRFIGIELNYDYVDISRKLIEEDMPLINVFMQGAL
ncbi:MAG: site-specific DNA-methyltransferase [Candidatus Caldatribacteriota bacterium]